MVLQVARIASSDAQSLLSASGWPMSGQWLAMPLGHRLRTESRRCSPSPIHTIHVIDPPANGCALGCPVPATTDSFNVGATSPVQRHGAVSLSGRRV